MVQRFLAAACVLALPIACATAGNGSAPFSPAHDGGGDNGGDDDDGGGSLGDAASAHDTAPPPQHDAQTLHDSGGSAQDATVPGEVALPFYVADQYVPSGFMGDSPTSMSGITLTHDPAHCKTPRDPAAGGDCYGITWAAAPADGGSAWAGVYWQSPSNNWGASPGKPIAPGATKVSFLAAGAVGGETIQACAGGIASSTLPHADTFNVKSPSLALTTTWTRYEISLQGATYTEVLGGFCWVAAATTSTSTTFYIDDVHWE